MSYVYQPLERHQIRILHLLPGRTGDELVGQIRIVNLDDDVEFDALSCMWGDPTPTSSIRIDVQALPIANNLSKALQRLRYTDRPLAIWVDAVCINQEDLEERSQQVRLMRRLYSSARVVRSWINVSVDTSCETFKALQLFEKTEDIDQCYGLGTDPTFYDPIVPIFTDPYWDRVWIQQEVLNAKELAIHCENVYGICCSFSRYGMSWSWLRDTLRRFLNVNLRMETKFGSCLVADTASSSGRNLMERAGILAAR